MKSRQLYFFNILFIYSWETQKERQRHSQREEKQAPCKEPNAGLDPGNPGLSPEPKANAQLLSHPGIPGHFFLFFIFYDCSISDLFCTVALTLAIPWDYLTGIGVGVRRGKQSIKNTDAKALPQEFLISLVWISFYHYIGRHSLVINILDSSGDSNV